MDSLSLVSPAGGHFHHIIKLDVHFFIFKKEKYVNLMDIVNEIRGTAAWHFLVTFALFLRDHLFDNFLNNFY